MSVFVSNQHMYVQFIDDVAGRTLATTSTVGDLKEKAAGKNNAAVAKEMGIVAAKVAQEKGIKSVVFDRGGFAYKGRVKALAEAARENGLQF